MLMPVSRSILIFCIEIGHRKCNIPKCDPILAVSGRDRPPSHLPDCWTLSGSGWSDANDTTRLDRCRFRLLLLFRFISKLEFLTEQSCHLRCNISSRFHVRPGNGLGTFVQPYRLRRRGCEKRLSVISKNAYKSQSWILLLTTLRIFSKDVFLSCLYSIGKFRDRPKNGRYNLWNVK